MNINNYCEWLYRQGHRVIKTKSSYWYNAGPCVYQAFPYDWLINPDDNEINDLLIGQRALALRYSSPIDSFEGLVSYHACLKKPYNLDLLPGKTRRNISNGLRNTHVEKISFDQLAIEGWNLQQDTLLRQGRLDCMHQADWEKICLSAKNLPGFEAWGAFVNNELAASLMTVCIDNTCYFPYAQSLKQYLCLHVNNALFYTVCCEMLARENITGLFFSLHSLDARDSVNEFKVRMHFDFKLVRQRVVFNPLIASFINGSTYKMLMRTYNRFPHNNTLSKLEGMFRFYLEGKKPICEQEWPECVSKYKMGEAEIDKFARE